MKNKGYSLSGYMSSMSWLGTLLYVITHSGPPVDGETSGGHQWWPQGQRRGHRAPVCTGSSHFPMEVCRITSPGTSLLKLSAMAIPEVEGLDERENLHFQ